MEPNKTFHEFLDALEGWYRSLDQALVEQAKKSEKTFTCRECSHKEPGCCYQKVFVPFHEALPIVRRIKENNLDTPEFRERLRVEGEEGEAASREEWFHTQRRPCVFLKDGRCSIYEVRPTACRTYYVISPQDDCQPGRHNGVLQLDVRSIDAGQITRARMIHRELGLKESNKRILMGILPRLVLIGLETWGSDDYQETVRKQIWPTDDGIGNGWIDGENHFGRLYSIRTKAKAKEG